MICEPAGNNLETFAQQSVCFVPVLIVLYNRTLDGIFQRSEKMIN